MNQTPNLSTLISELVTGVITGVSTARRFHFRTLLVVAITVAVGAFTMGLALRDYTPGKSAPDAQGARLTSEPDAQGAPLTPEPTRNQQSKPPPSKDHDGEELRQLIHPNPM